MSARPRNNIARLPQPVRAVIAELLDDGATYDDIRADIRVATACGERNLALHPSTFIAYRESAEYDEFRRARRRYGEDIERRRMAAMFVDQEHGADALARVANFELLRIVLGKLEAGDELEPKELSAISGALAAYERNRLSSAKDDAQRAAAAREAEYQSKIAELERRVEELSGTAKSAGLTTDAIKQIEEQAGLL